MTTFPSDFDLQSGAFLANGSSLGFGSPPLREDEFGVGLVNRNRDFGQSPSLSQRARGFVLGVTALIDVPCEQV